MSAATLQLFIDRKKNITYCDYKQ